jgi:hypothetical protein
MQEVAVLVVVAKEDPYYGDTKGATKRRVFHRSLVRTSRQA